MRYAHHGGTTLHANLVEDVRVAQEVGYDSVELWVPKVLRYLDAGFTADDLAAELVDLRVPMLDVIVGVERDDREHVEQRLEECVRLAELASRIECPAIQVVATNHFRDDSWPAQRRVLVRSLGALADITAQYGVRLAIEPLVYSPFNTIRQALEVIEALGPDRAGLCLDTWHLWTSGDDLDAVSRLDRTLILSAQLSDTQPRAGQVWHDLDRTALPGDGIIPLAEVVAAVTATGYDGHWCVEMLSPRHREWRAQDLAVTLLDRLQGFVPREPG